MGTSKLVSKLDEFFDLSGKEQKKKQEKLLKIISKLDEKKAGIMEEMAVESEHDETSERFHELGNELKVIARLLKKARKHVYDKGAADQDKQGD